MTAHMGHQRRDAGAPGDRRKLAGRAPDVAEAVQLLPRGQPRGGVHASGSQRGVYLVIGSRCVGVTLKEGRHGRGGLPTARRPPVRAGDPGSTPRPRAATCPRTASTWTIGQRRRAGGQPLLPKRFAPKLDEVGVTLTFLDDLAQPVLGDMDNRAGVTAPAMPAGRQPPSAGPRRVARSPGGSRRSRPSSRAARATPACPPAPAGKAPRSAPVGLR